MNTMVLAVFILVYLGMILGRIPGLALDRTGVALLGAIALLTCDQLTTAEALRAIDTPTIALLFGLMVVSAQFRLGGFYSHLVRRLAGLKISPEVLLALLIGVAGVLSALLANDIVCLSVTPVLVSSCARRGLDPKPFLLALACAANVGSAATLIGNPQNMLIGQVLRLSFRGYLWEAGLPAVLGLVIIWVVIRGLTGGRWKKDSDLVEPVYTPLNSWQTTKGSIILLALIGAFLAAPWPRDILALTAAGALLCSRRMQSREMLGLIDWQLLVLFLALFVVNYAMKSSGNLELVQRGLDVGGIRLESPAWLFGVCVVLSNLVSNVPAVMLLLPSATHPIAGPVLALSSTLAGNLFIVGSLANIIVVDQAAMLGVKISWSEHARVGIPVTILTLALAAGWLWIIDG
ncbi:MAG: anion transporter [Deltaproteobacteria bacterium]|nr:anion transporter [Deltaproteobacteria bacterium]